MQYTENYKLRKPEPDDYIQVADFNKNSDEIDTQLKKISEALKVLDTKGVNLADLLKNKADLVNGKVSINQLPELDEYKEILMYELKGQFPATGKDKKLYLDKSNGTLYRWNGNSYVVVAEKLEIGIKQGTAFDGKRGKDLEDNLKNNYYNKTEIDKLVKNLKAEMNSDILTQILAFGD